MTRPDEPGRFARPSFWWHPDWRARAISLFDLTGIGLALLFLLIVLLQGSRA